MGFCYRYNNYYDWQQLKKWILNFRVCWHVIIQLWQLVDVWWYQEHIYGKLFQGCSKLFQHSMFSTS